MEIPVMWMYFIQGTGCLNGFLQITAEVLVAVSLWQSLEYMFASWNIKPENKIVESGLHVFYTLLVLFSKTYSLRISSSSLYCPTEPVSLILGISDDKGKNSCVSLLTHDSWKKLKKALYCWSYTVALVVKFLRYRTDKVFFLWYLCSVSSLKDSFKTRNWGLAH